MGGDKGDQESFGGRHAVMFGNIIVVAELSEANEAGSVIGESGWFYSMGDDEAVSCNIVCWEFW